MKLQRLSGFGPIAAYVSAASLLVFFFLQQFGSAIGQAAPGMAVPAMIVFLVALAVWVAALNVVVLDLEWIQHPSTSTSWFLVARIAILVALVMPALLYIQQFNGVGLPFGTYYALTFVPVGLSLLVHNLDGRRAGLLRGVLPWLGIVTGLAFAVAGLGFASLLVPMGTTLFTVGWNALLLGQVLYIVWAIWMGVKLSRSNAAAPAAAQSAMA